MSAKIKRNICRMKDPGSAITHLIAMVSAAIAAVPPKKERPRVYNELLVFLSVAKHTTKRSGGPFLVTAGNNFCFRQGCRPEERQVLHF